jgi:hypothetical protein
VSRQPARFSPMRHLRNVLAWPDTRFLGVMFLVTQVLDVVTTWRALATHRFREGNPWLDDVTNRHPFLVYGAKLALAMLILTALLLLRLRWRLRLAILAIFTAASLVGPITNILRIRGMI